MKAYGGVDVQIHLFLTSALVGGEWSASRHCRFTPGQIATGTHCIGVWMDPRAGLNDVEKRKFLTLPGLELRPLCRPARSQSLYRLSYPGSQPRRCMLIYQRNMVPQSEVIYLCTLTIPLKGKVVPVLN
jgi:hypothetical protein